MRNYILTGTFDDDTEDEPWTYAAMKIEG